MIDWHSHILPGMDDGSRDVAESISLVKMQMSQGISTVIATPHFYANDEAVETFLSRRRNAFEALRAELPGGHPKILLGAEVKYYPGISRMEELKALSIEGTKLVLLEMPMSEWTEYMVRELTELAAKNSVRIILAHIDRYLKFQKTSVLDRIIDCGILMQANASFFTTFASKRNAISLLREGSIRFIGSDCHNMTSRPPKIDKAFDIIRKKLGDNYIRQLNEYGYSLLAPINN